MLEVWRWRRCRTSSWAMAEARSSGARQPREKESSTYWVQDTASLFRLAPCTRDSKTAVAWSRPHLMMRMMMMMMMIMMMMMMIMMMMVVHRACKVDGV